MGPIDFERTERLIAGPPEIGSRVGVLFTLIFFIDDVDLDLKAVGCLFSRYLNYIYYCLITHLERRNEIN